MKQWFGSLFVRIFAGFWLAMASIILTVTWLSFVAINQAQEQGYNPRETAHEARTVLARDGVEGLRDWLKESRPGPTLLIVDPRGRELLGRTVRQRHLSAIERRGPRAHNAFQLRDAEGNVYLAIARPPALSIGPFRFASPRRSVGIAALVISALVCFMLARQIVRPIRRIGSAAGALGSGQLGARANLDAGGSELIALGRQFDDMAARIEALLGGQRELLRNVSHELRSPLARLRMALELARSNEARLEPALERIERETVALDALIAQVLRLARVGDPDAPFPLESVDLHELIRDIVADASFETGERQLAVRYDAADRPIVLDAPSALLRAAIDNVVRNALRYSDGDIAIRSRIDQSDAVVTVEDSGPGVDPAQLQTIFEPFHRTASARDRDSGGEGIGLAITDAVIRRLGGDARADNRSEGGLRVTLRVPLPSR